MKAIREIALTLAGATVALSAVADDKEEMFNPIVTSVISQSIAPDARAGGLGDVGAATDPDVNSQAWNPAKYPFCISRAGVSIDYTPWLRSIVNDIDLAYLVGYYRLGDYQALSASVRYFSLGSVMTDDPNMTVKPYEMAFDVAYSRMLSERFSAAVALRYMYSDMSGHYDDQVTAGSAFAADIACYYNNYVMMGNRECQIAFGVNLSNIGSKINYGEDYSYFIPTNLRIGLNYMIPLNEYNRISFCADINKLLVPSRPLQEDNETDEDFQDRVQREYYDVSSISGMFKSFGDSPNGFKGELEEVQWSVGAEYTYNDKFTVRAGYHHESESQCNRKYFTFGAGFRMSVFSIDAGYVWSTAASNPLDQTLRVSLAFDFDGIRDLFRGRR